ncbi:MAG TPA: retroviral-like aspartic protease family protein [Sphingomicrobium sp.]|jgi:predicted aspartyl protease|nr:retroviral-like aspartic protease family protein [Sphingomicrobium sp.]
MRITAAVVALLVTSGASAEPMLFDNGRLFIPATINGIATEALLDSGAETTVVDPKLASKAKLPEGQAIAIKGSGGRALARLVEETEVEALGVKLHPEAVVVTELSDISRRLVKRPLAMILGREIFDSARLRVDIAGRAVDVVPKDGTPPGTKLPLTTHAGIESIPVTVNGKAAQAEFDLGNGSGVLISRAFANRLHLKRTGQRSGGGIGGKLTRDLIRIDRIEVAGITFRDVEAAVDDQANANDLNIGTSILKNFLITTDFAARSVWLTSNRGERG